MAGELSSRARELLQRERDRSESAALKARAMERARAALERPSGIGFRQAQSTALPPPRRWVRTLPLAAAASAAASFAGAGVSTYVGGKAIAPSTLSKTVVPRARHVAVGGALLDAAPSNRPPLERPRETRPAAPNPETESSRAPSVRQYATELALLQPARSSISQGAYQAALAAIDQHRREFPNGQLSEEREALRVRALWGLGQKQAALSAVKVFRKRYPRSGLLSWLKVESDGAP